MIKIWQIQTSDPKIEQKWYGPHVSPCRTQPSHAARDRKIWFCFFRLFVTLWLVDFVLTTSSSRGWNRETVLVLLDGERFVVVHPRPTLSLHHWMRGAITECWSWKYGQIKAFFTTQGQHSKPIQIAFGMLAYTVRLLLHARFGLDRSRLLAGTGACLSTGYDDVKGDTKYIKCGDFE